MTLPAWVSRKGLVMHVGVGSALTVLFVLLGASPALTFVAVYCVAVAHEIGDGDLKKGGNELGGWPWNGLLDVVTFLPAPLILWLVT